MEKMTSRERVRKAINHQVSDRVPIDFGATTVSNIHVAEASALRQKLPIEQKLTKAVDPLLMASLVEPDMRDALEIDCIGVWGKSTSIGVRNDGFKPFTLPSGTQILVCDGFEYDIDDDGAVWAYAQGNRNYPPSAKMPSDGLYFDPVARQEDLSAKTEWNARKDYKDMYSVFTDAELREFEDEATDLYNNTQCALVGTVNGSLGDAFHVPGPWLTESPGIRDMKDWFMGFYQHPDYIKELFEMHTEIAMENFKLYWQAVGDKVDIMFLSAVDFAYQEGLMISPKIYRKFFAPCFKKMTDWIHENTTWKTLIHSCGSVIDLIPDIIDSGFDILNPVQISAKGMSPAVLKEKFGKDIVFWGGACDPQTVLVHGTPEEVYDEVKKNAAIFAKDGGYVGGNVHNVQCDVPVENLLAEIRALKDTIPE